jgi:hypothetical protein
MTAPATSNGDTDKVSVRPTQNMAYPDSLDNQNPSIPWKRFPIYRSPNDLVEGFVKDGVPGTVWSCDAVTQPLKPTANPAMIHLEHPR